jgi:translation initiation factor IF-2
LATKAAKTGTRVNALAKELEVDSKDILAKLKAEGLDWAHNHMSTLSAGQAETVRQWHRDGELASSLKAGGHEDAGAASAGTETAEEGGGTATATKVKSTRRTGKKKSGAADEAGTTTVVAEAPLAEAGSPGAGGATIVAETAAADALVAPEAKVARSTKAKAPPVPDVGAGQSAVIEAPAVPPAAPVAPPGDVARIAAEAPSVAATPPTEAGSPGAPAAPTAPPPAMPRPPMSVQKPTIRPDPLRQPIQRPTVTLENRKQMQSPPKPVTFTPRPASIQGPRVVREEKPDVVPAPRPRTRPGEGGGPAPAFTPARPQGGRGVKRLDEDGNEETAEAKKKEGTSGRSTRRRGPDGRRGEAEEKLREFTDADLIERRDRLLNAEKTRQAFDSHLKKNMQRGTHQITKTGVSRGEPIEIELPITVRRLSETMGVKANELLVKLMRQGVMANINQSLDIEAAQAIALDYGVELQVKREDSIEDQLEQMFGGPGDPEMQAPRPPVVAILGHVDHGKTSLLDKIRSANVAAGEAGGITQHIAAWMVEIKGSDGTSKRVTFIDTPGHQAFTGMRARGANMTDVVVLVVSAAEGVQPQTIESINHAKAAEVPIVVAMNKIDRPDADPNKVLGQLGAQGLNPTEYGGDTEVVRVSAITGEGVPNLIEILDLQSQLMELKADPTSPAVGTVIESKMDPGLGAAATVLVQNGTLKVGDVMLVGSAYGRIRSLVNDKGQMVQEAGPSTPVIVAGLDELPGSGDRFFVMPDLEQARTIAAQRATRSRELQLGSQNRISGGDLLNHLQSATQVQTINLIIKADVQGSIETLVNSVTNMNTEEVKVRVIHSGVGAISESDVQLAMATKTKPTDNRVAIIGFHVVPDDSARMLAEQNHIDVKTYRVIYEIFDDLKKSLSGMLEPEVREKLHGHADIRKVFKYSKVGSIAGCFVTDGHIQRGSKIRLIRDGRVITEDLAIETLKRLKDDVREVKQGFECGIKLAGYDDIKEGDRLEAYIREKHERTL